MTPTPEQTLAALRHSLELPLPPSPSPPDATPVKAVDVAQALLVLPDLVQSLRTLVDERQRLTDVLERFTTVDTSVQRVARHVEDVATANQAYLAAVERRLQYLERGDARYRQMIDRVTMVLDHLDTVLKRM